jgi:DNA-binding transcriptional ArsR family regulator
MKIDIEAMLAAANEATGLLKSLANRHRLLIVCQLIGAERSVGELAGLLKLRSSTVSQHLALLRRDRVVAARRDGQTIWYSIGSREVRELVRTLYRVYCGADPSLAVKRGRVPRPAGRRPAVAPNQ